MKYRLFIVLSMLAMATFCHEAGVAQAETAADHQVMEKRESTEDTGTPEQTETVEVSQSKEAAETAPNPYSLCESSEKRFCVLNPEKIDAFIEMSPKCSLFYFTLKQFSFQWKIFKRILKRIETIGGHCHQALVEYYLSPDKMDDEIDPPKEGYWLVTDGKYKKYEGRIRPLDIFRWTVKSAFDIVHSLKDVEELDGFKDLKSYALLINPKKSDQLSMEYKRLAREIKDLNFLQTTEAGIAAKFNCSDESAIVLVTNFNDKFEKLPIIEDNLDLNAVANFLNDKRRTDLLKLDMDLMNKYLQWRDTNVIRIVGSGDKQRFIDFARRFNGIKNPDESPQNKEALNKLFNDGFMVEGFWPNFMQVDSNEPVAKWLQFMGGRSEDKENEDWILVLRKEDDEIHKWVLTEWTFESLKNALLELNEGQYARFYLSQSVAAQDNLPVIGLTKQTLEEEVIESKRSALVLVYSPGCGFCGPKREMMKKLAALYEGTPNFGIYEIDGTANEHESFYVESFPVLLFYNESDKMDPEVLNEDADFEKIVKRFGEIGIRPVKTDVGSEL